MHAHYESKYVVRSLEVAFVTFYHTSISWCIMNAYIILDATSHITIAWLRETDGQLSSELLPSNAVFRAARPRDRRSRRFRSTSHNGADLMCIYYWCHRNGGCSSCCRRRRCCCCCDCGIDWSCKISTILIFILLNAVIGNGRWGPVSRMMMMLLSLLTSSRPVLEPWTTRTAETAAAEANTT